MIFKVDYPEYECISFACGLNDTEMVLVCSREDLEKTEHSDENEFVAIGREVYYKSPEKGKLFIQTSRTGNKKFFIEDLLALLPKKKSG